MLRDVSVPASNYLSEKENIDDSVCLNFVSACEEGLGCRRKTSCNCCMPVIAMAAILTVLSEFTAALPRSREDQAIEV